MIQTNNAKTKTWIFDFVSLIVIFILALLFRLVYLYQYQNSPFFDSPIIDALSHYIYAVRIAAGDWLIKGLVAPRVPLYVYFLAVLFRFLGTGFFAAKVAQMVLGSINCLLVYALGKQLFGRRVGLISGIICALYGVLIYFDAEFLSVGLTIFLNLNLLFAVFATINKPKIWKWLASGVLFGICLQTSPNIILFLPLLCACVYYYNSKRQSEIANRKEIQGYEEQKEVIKIQKPKRLFYINRTAFMPLVYLCIGAFLSILPLSLRNLVQGGEFVLLTSTVGVNLYIGNNPDADGKSAVPPSRDFSYQGWEDNVWVSSIKVAQSETGRNLNNSQVSNFWMFKTAKYIIQHPVHFIGLTLRKLYYLLNAYEIPENQSIYFFRLWSSLLTILVFSNSFISFPFGIIAPLALLGMFITFDKNNQKLMVLNCFILAHLMLMVIFFVVSRYRSVLVPYFVIYAAYAGVWLIDNLRQMKFKLLFRFFIGLIILFLYCNQSFFGVAHEDKSKWFFNLGAAFRYKGQNVQALKSFEQAYEINPWNIDALYNIGVLHLENQRFDQAIKIFEQVIEQDPSDSAAYNNIGLALFKQKNFDQAINVYNKVLELDPDDLGAMVNLGSVYAVLEKHNQALAIFEKVIKIDSKFAPAYNHRAALYEILGQPILAEKDYLKAIELNSKYMEAYYNLALLYKSQDRMDEYKIIYAKSLELMPFGQIR